MYNEIFCYLSETPSYDEIINSIGVLENKYEKRLENFNTINFECLKTFNEPKYIELIKDYKKIVLEIINDVISLFPRLNKIPHIVFLHGSFAKTINRMSSDIDLNILYSNKYKEILLPIEELISIAIYKILGYSGREKVHTMMIYLPTISGEKRVAYDTNQCFIRFENGNILNYNCKKNFEAVMNKIILSSREFDDFKAYIQKNSTSNMCEEWCYSFEELEKNVDDDIYDLIRQNDEKIISNPSFLLDFKLLINNLIKRIELYNFEYIETLNMKDINMKLKVENLGLIYNFLALIRRYLVYNNQNIKKLDLFELLNNDKLKKTIGDYESKELMNAIIKYLMQLSRMEYLFKKNNHNFSSRSDEVISKSYIDEKYFKIFGEVFLKVQNDVQKKLHDHLTRTLEKLIIE